MTKLKSNIFEGKNEEAVFAMLEKLNHNSTTQIIEKI